MNGANSLSLRKFSNKAAVAFALVVVAAELMINPNHPNSYFLTASIIGLVWGTLRCLGFGERQWQSSVIILFQTMIYIWLFPLHSGLGTEGFGSSLLSMWAFFCITILYRFFVVWLKELDERRAQKV